MSKVSKTYRLTKRFFFQFKVKIDGDLILVEFNDGKRHTKPQLKGCLRTANSQLQKALEESPYFGKKYVLESTVKIDVDEPEEELEVRSEEINPKEDEVEETRLTKVGADEVENFQQAKNYLVEKFKVTHRDVSNKDKVLEVAKQNKVFFEGIE
jgi:hypothetical protein